MQPIAFCNRCRGMKVGWNRRYVLHSLICRELISKSCKLMILTAVLSSFIFAFPVPTEVVLSTTLGEQDVQPTVVQASLIPLPKPAVTSIERLLSGYRVNPDLRSRVAQAIVASSRKYNVEPRLVASIMIVESRANPFAISDKDSIGIMQIHLPTWGPTAEKQGINLFKIEDNVDLGVRILKDYIARHGMWDGVMRYKGFTSDPLSQQGALEYVQKVQRVYGIEPQPAAETTIETAIQ
jgi:soluble lytic murein transglycosylase-like protein